MKGSLLPAVGFLSQLMYRCSCCCCCLGSYIVLSSLCSQRSFTGYLGDDAAAAADVDVDRNGSGEKCGDPGLMASIIDCIRTCLAVMGDFLLFWPDPNRGWNVTPAIPKDPCSRRMNSMWSYIYP